MLTPKDIEDRVMRLIREEIRPGAVDLKALRAKVRRAAAELASLRRPTPDRSTGSPARWPMGSQTSFAGMGAGDAHSRIDEVLRQAEFERRMGCGTTDMAALQAAFADAVEELEELEDLRAKVETLDEELDDAKKLVDCGLAKSQRDDGYPCNNHLDDCRACVRADAERARDCGLSKRERQAGDTCKWESGDGALCAACRVAKAINCGLSAEERDEGEPCKGDDDCAECRIAEARTERGASSDDMLDTVRRELA